MSIDLLERLSSEWRDEAAQHRHRGCNSGVASCLESCADELESVLSEWKLELLTLEEAAQEVGKTYDTMQRKVSKGVIPNAGEKGSPRVRRADLHAWLEVPEPRSEDDPVEELAQHKFAREASVA